MTNNQPLRVAYTPDSDDAYYYDAIETGNVLLSGYQPLFTRRPICELNHAARQGVYDVTAISSVAYPQIADRYAILSVGTSVGRGYGPVLVSKGQCKLEDLRGKRVGVPGIPTTGWFLLRTLCPEAIPIEMEYDKIADAVAVGELDAGVMIHEELLYYPQLKLDRVVDLGAEWCQRHHLPLPVGLNVIRRDLGQANMQRICTAIRCSLEYALDHNNETLARVIRLGRGSEGRCTEQFVAMFANADSVWMPLDVRIGLSTLFFQLMNIGLSSKVPSIDVVEGLPSESRQRSKAS